MADEANPAVTDPNPTPTPDPSPTPTDPSDPNPTPDPASSNTDDDDSVDLSKKPAAAEAKEGEGDDDEPSELIGAPAEGESYAIEGLPEGMEVNAEMLEAVTPVLRGLNASNAAASKLAQVYAEQITKTLDKNSEAFEASIVAKRAEWEGEARDLVAGKGETLKNEAGEPLGFGGKSQKEVMAASARVLDKLAPAGFREFLDETGLAVHPHMVALTYQVGKLIAEDRELEDTSTASGAKKSTTSRFYGR